MIRISTWALVQVICDHLKDKLGCQITYHQRDALFKDLVYNFDHYVMIGITCNDVVSKITQIRLIPGRERPFWYCDEKETPFDDTINRPLVFYQGQLMTQEEHDALLLMNPHP